jgi:hypothetical protein
MSELFTGRPPTRYAKQPRTSERLYMGPGETWQITAVHDHGRTLEVVDAIGRPWTRTRADAGWWLVTDAD